MEARLGTGSHRTDRRSTGWRCALILLLLAAFAAGFLLTGCGDDPPTAPAQPGPKPRPVLSSPQVVLAAMMESYSARDTTGYTRLFDAAYSGLSFDPNDPVNPSIQFNWADEQRHIQALAERATITGVYLTFGYSSVRFTDLGDPPGWATIQTNAMQLEIRDGADGIMTPANVLEEFKFIPTAPAPESSTDTTWTIIRWSEVAP